MTNVVPVKTYSHLSAGSPQLSNEYGRMGLLLEAILVTGYASTDIVALSWSAGLLKVTVASAALGQPFSNNRPALITGCNNAEMNGEFVVDKSNGADFWLRMPVAPTSLTGSSGTVKIAPLGWELVHKQTLTGIEAIYHFKNKASKPVFLRIVDRTDITPTGNYGKYARASIHQNVDSTGVFSGLEAPFWYSDPTFQHDTRGSTSGLVTGSSKWMYSVTPGNNTLWSSSAEYYNHVWDIVGDDKSFFLSVRPSSSTDHHLYGCGNFKSYVENDPFPHFLMTNFQNTIFSSTYTMSSYGCPRPMASNNTGNLLLADMTGKQPNQSFRFSIPYDGTVVSGCGGFAYPDPVNGQVYLSKPRIVETVSNGIRGEFSQFRWLHHSSSFFGRGSVISEVVGEPGKEFIWLPGGDRQYQSYTGDERGGFFFDRTGPWEY